MTAKEYLKQARTIDMEINTKIEELHQLKLKASCVQSVAISERVKTSHENSSNKIIDEIVDLQNEINTEIDKLVDLKTEIRKNINKISDTRYVSILTNYYINRKTWEEIAEITKYDLRWVHRLHSRALKALEEATKSH